MSDVVGLAPGHWQWSGWLTPKGRVIALFALVKLDDQTVWLLVPDVDAVALATQLKRFVFRSKVAIAVRDDLVVAGAFLRPEGAEGARLAANDAGGVELDIGGDGGPRSLRIATTPAPEDATALARWARFDLEHGLPRLPPSQAEQWTPQMLSLDRLRAYSVKKGCYPGQEIVARTHFLGQAKRGLVLLESIGSLAAGDPVSDDGGIIGTIASVAEANGSAVALAVLPANRAVTRLSTGGNALCERPLRDGLAR